MEWVKTAVESPKNEEEEDESTFYKLIRKINNLIMFHPHY